jgi:hypothetical protein
MGSEQARLLAERIARRIDGGSVRDSSPAAAPNIAAELSAMRSTLNELQTRLSRIESKVTTNASVPQVHSPWLAGLNDSHPSQERFGVEEATVAQLVDYFQGEKACSMEPGKPCDHCAMCSSRGF